MAIYPVAHADAREHPHHKTIAGRISEMLQERRLPGRVERVIDRFFAAAGVTEKTIRRGPYRFRIRRLTADENFVESVAIRGEYHPPGFEIQPGENVVDIGGNIGTFAIPASRVAKLVITAEPSKANFALLECNIRLNRATNIRPIRAAVCARQGTVVLRTDPRGGFNSILDDRGGPISEEVPAVSLNTIFRGLDRVDFLKVDCEGAEHEIFHSAPDELLSIVRRIGMEWHGAVDREERIKQGSDLAERLVAAGFHIVSFTEFPAGFRGGMLFARR